MPQLKGCPRCCSYSESLTLQCEDMSEQLRGFRLETARSLSSCPPVTNELISAMLEEEQSKLPCKTTHAAAA